MTQPTEADVVFSSVGGVDLLLDLYLPSPGRGSDPLPVVIWLHGGGWALGDRSLAPDLAARAEATGLAFASVEYRLSGTAAFPAQLFDVRDAVRFLRANAARWNLAPDRIGLWGGSAGGHLAALAGVTGHIERLPGEPRAGDASVAAVAASYPPVDLGAVIAASATRPGYDPRQSFEARLLGDLPSNVPELAAAANPVTFVTPSAPPFQLSHGTGDMLVTAEQSRLLHDALTAAGVASELYLLDGYRHGFLNPAGRVDVSVSSVMDDGRLEREGAAAATLASGDGPPAPAEFGFSTIDRFLVASLTAGG